MLTSFNGKISAIAVLLSVVFFALIVMETVGTATTIYVPDDYPTIQGAVDAASSGDTIMVSDGTYTENVNVNKDHLTIQSKNGPEKTIVQAATSGILDHVFEIDGPDHVTISGFTVKGATGTFAAGIHVASHFVGEGGYCQIKNNIIENNYYAIHIIGADNTIIDENLINGSYIWASSSNSNTISNNDLDDSYISLSNSSNNLISGNTISGNAWYGIAVSSSSSNTISNNTIKDYKSVGGISLSGSDNLISNNTFEGCGLRVHSAGNTVENCTVNGRPLIYLENETGLEIAATDAGQIILVRCQNMVVRDCYLSNTSPGITFYATSDSLVERNTLKSNGTGIYFLSESTDNIIRNNTCTDNGEGIAIASFSNMIQDNAIHSNSWGISLRYYSQHNIVQNNDIYSNLRGIYLGSCLHNIIQDNNIYNNNYGVYVYYSAIHVHDGVEEPIKTENNNILCNSILNNTKYGIFLSYSLNNNIYLNNFNNANNAYSSPNSTDIWNSPEEIPYTYGGNRYRNYLGNHWSDYSGSDADGDGIGDTPYSINTDQDNYPLMVPFENYVISTGTPAVFRVTREGDVRTDGAFYGQTFETGSADVAEWVTVSEPVEPGDILELDPDNPGQYRKARGPCSDLVAGVVSSNSGVILGSSSPTPDTGPWTLDSALLALLGIVPVKVTNEGGPIQPGDLLVTSSTPGHAMRWNPDNYSPCDLVGKALEPLTDERGVILVLLMSH